MNYNNFERHIQRLSRDVYPEPVSLQHTNASKDVLEKFCRNLIFDNVIEFGCGTAPSLDILKSWGKTTFGVTLKDEVVNHPTIREDMHFTNLPDTSYDLVIARHVLEHSYMPLILLMEMRRVAIKYALVVVPTSDKKMIEWPNHYSVLPKENWEHLFKLSRWEVLKFEEAPYCFEPEYTFIEYRYLLKTS
jgi:hypothetical protein